MPPEEQERSLVERADLSGGVEKDIGHRPTHDVWFTSTPGNLISVGAITASAADHLRANDAGYLTIFVVERYSYANTTKEPVAL
jgi:hypothetical protein